MYPIQTVEPEYVADLIKHQKYVALHLKNGNKFIGILVGMTEEAIFFKDVITQVFYKKAINTINPLTQLMT
jgi:sRNA-binding regulator protein Hfq